MYNVILFDPSTAYGDPTWRPVKPFILSPFHSYLDSSVQFCLTQLLRP
jgi:hypothetical protein